MLCVGLLFRWCGVLGLLKLVYILFFFDVGCWPLISLMGWVRVSNVGFHLFFDVERFCVLFVGRSKLVLHCALFVYDVVGNSFMGFEVGY